MRFIYISAALILLSCQIGAAAFADDAMERGSRKLAGPDAIDCGRVGIYKDPKSATDCALSAFNGNKPFRVLYDFWNIDSAVAAGVLRTPAGKVYGVIFDSAGMRNSSEEELRYFIATPCPDPVHVFVTKNGHLNCFPPTKTNGTLMSSDFFFY